MNIFEAEKVVNCSLIKQGGYCRFENVEPGLKNLIVTWKSTLWRICVRVVKNDILSCWPTDDEIEISRERAKVNNQSLIIAFVNPDKTIEYRAFEDKRIIRPRCIIKVRKVNEFVKELY